MGGVFRLGRPPRCGLGGDAVVAIEVLAGRVGESR